MISGLIDLSAHDFPQHQYKILECFQEASEALEAPFLVIGAFAFELILERHYHYKLARITLDMDFGIYVDGWNKYGCIVNHLLKAGNFSKDNKQQQRLIYGSGFAVDLVPFGGISDNHKIFWPPENDFSMSVLGFPEAFKLSLSVKLKTNPDLIVKVASPTGLAILKIFAWDDRRRRGEKKDATDFDVLLSNYLDFGNHARLISQYPEMLTADFDYKAAGAQLLGMDICAEISPNTKAALVSILSAGWKPGITHPLVEDMMNGLFDGGDSFVKKLVLIEKFIKHLRLGT